MKRIKKSLAMLLAVLILLSTVPMAFAAEAAEDAATPESVAASPDASEDYAKGEYGALEYIAVHTKDAAYENASAAGSEIIFNLGTLEITVGFDEERYNGWTYMLFDEDGNFTIRLEDNAFFPYEVQFQAGGATFVEWFETPSCYVVIGDHVFTVFTEQNNPYMLQSISLFIGGEYVALRPEPKEFTNEPFAPLSLLPLQTFNLWDLDLRGLTPAQLSSVPISTVLSGQTPDNNPTHVVWARSGEGVFRIIDYVSGRIDLRPPNMGSSSFSLELIVGSGLQLDETNIRYRVNGNITPQRDVLSFELFRQAEGQPRTEVTVIDTTSGTEIIWLIVDGYEIEPNEEAYLGLNWSSAFAGQPVPRVLLGSFADAASAAAAVTANPAIDITNSIWAQTMTSPSAGFRANLFAAAGNRDFTLIEDANGVDVVTPMSIRISRQMSSVEMDGLYATSTATGFVAGTTSVSIQAGVRIFTRAIDRPSEMYYLRMWFFPRDRSGTDNSRVARAVAGHFSTVDEMNAQPDISAQLFPADFGVGGYRANFSGEGRNFTALDVDGRIFQFTVRTTQRVVPAEPWRPNPGSQDAFFRIQGATELHQRFFITPWQHDSYHDRGFQTVFYLQDEIPSSALTPIFWTSLGTTIYHGHGGSAGTQQLSGQNTHDFSDGPVHFSVAAEDGTSQRNYWITFVPRHVGGSRLFVNAINGDNGARREVFLTGRITAMSFHDILIANVGDAELTGLNAVLSNATNIELCSYWTVGGAGNDTLAAFTNNSFQFSTSEFADNIAKIRIIPTGEGEISGTLTISSNDGQEPVVIEITGHAGDPRLLTETIPDAVRHVPFSVQLLHNNRFPWNTVTMEVTGGTLPPGVAMRPNGEIYGVPQETGTFTFSVRMTNSDTRFGQATAQFTIVVQENTDEWVAWANEHPIIVPLPNVITTIADQIFEIDHPYDNFMRFFLAGQLLETGVDYVAEDGSTRITVRGQAIQRAGQGRQTIAAEFRVNRSEDSEMSRAAQNFTVSTAAAGGGGGDGGATIADTAVPTAQAPVEADEEPPVVTPLLREDVTADVVDEETLSIIEQAVARLAAQYYEATGKTLAQAGEAVSVTVEEPNTVATKDLPYGVSPSTPITMAMLNEDGTLTPIPTRINSDGTVSVLVSDTVILVPLNVEVNFIDINFGRQFQHVTDEINLAASLMIIQGRGNGIFDPTAMVTNQEAVTMFLRALGVPVDYSTAMVTARESGLNGIGAVPDAPMSRVNTARLIVNALYAMGMDPQISEQLAQSVLADFPDAGNLTGDERLALAICVYLGIFQGAAGGSLNPNQTLQRSQMASLAVRLQEVILGTQ